MRNFKSFPPDGYLLFCFILYFVFVRLGIIGMKHELPLIVMTCVYLIYYDDDET